MFNWYIPQEVKTVCKWIKRIGWAIVLGATAGGLGVMINTIRAYYN